MGHVLGGEKNNFLIRDIDGPGMDSHVDGILSIRGPEGSPRSPRVGTVHVQSTTAHALALLSVDTYQYRSSARHRA